MATIIQMPAIVADAAEAVVAAWNVAVGDVVTAGQVIAEIETEKATVDFEVDASGTVAALLFEAGDSVPVGVPIAVLAAEGESVDAAMATLTEAVGGAAPESADVPAPATAATSGTQGVGSPGAELLTEPAVAPSERRFASPLARRRAKELGLEIDALVGSGPGGRIIRSDVESAAQSLPQGLEAAPPAVQCVSEPGSPTAAAGQAGFTDEPLTGMRRAIARAVTANKTTIPHFYVTADVRLDELLVLRAQMNESLKPRGLKASVNDLILKALGNALASVPEANSAFIGDAIRRFDRVDIAVAMATDGGLLMPVVADVAGRGIASLCSATDGLKQRAASRDIKQHELQGGSFALSNLGMFGVREFSAIINGPHAGILAVGAGEQRPVVIDGELAVATVMTATISADHRVLDGAAAAQLMQAFKAQLEDPFRLLL
ncbi:dihydrolipoamide acetyltransferase family protein [Leucobacter sp. BZR 635]